MRSSKERQSRAPGSPGAFLGSSRARLPTAAPAEPSDTQQAPNPRTKVRHLHFITIHGSREISLSQPPTHHSIAKEQGLLKKGIGQCPLTSTISSSSGLSMQPFPSLSYTLNVHLSLCSSFPRKTRFKAATYSRKSMVLSCGNRKAAAGGHLAGQKVERKLLYSFQKAWVKAAGRIMYGTGICLALQGRFAAVQDQQQAQPHP